MNVFVYGSLKHGFHNHDILGSAQLLNKCRTVSSEFDLLDLGGFPGLVKGKFKIFGELYSVNQAGIMRLDLLEGHPNFYRRTSIFLIDDYRFLNGYTYMLQDGWGGSPVETFLSEGVKTWTG